MAFHISDKDGQPKPCKASTPESCPVGGEHYDNKERAQSFADEKLASEYSHTSTFSKKIDFSKREPMQPTENGRYEIAPGEYYVINSEAMDFDEYAGSSELREAVTDPSIGADARTDTMIGGNVGGEPVYSVKEGWSGVSNAIVTPKLYDALVKKGMNYSGGKPPVVVFTEPTTLGAVDGSPEFDNNDYGMMEVGNDKIDLFQGKNSIVLSERTVIGPGSIDFSNRKPMAKTDTGRYKIEPGEYYLINSEGVEFDNPDDSIDIQDSVFNPSNGADDRVDTIVGGHVGGEPVYSVQEGWSGVSNTFVTPKTYDSLVRKGMNLAYGDGKPPVVEFKKSTTLGSVNGDPTSPDYGLMEVGDKKIDFYHSEEKSMVMTDRTIID